MKHCFEHTLKCLCCLMFLLVGMNVEAQTRIPRELHLGVTGGATLSEYSFHPRISQQFAGSYSMGVTARYIEETTFGLQAELLLTERSMSDLYEPNPDGWEYQRKLLYLELPILAHVYFPLGKRNEVALDLGPKLAYFLSDRSIDHLPDDFGVSLDSYMYNTLHHSLPIAKKFDYGLQVGLGYEFKINKEYSAQLSGRYYFGLANLWPDSKADDFEQSNNQSIQIMLTVWWHKIIKGKKTKK